MEFESLIFDIDGTLWDTRALVAEGFNLQLRQEGIHCVPPIDAEALRPLFGKVLEDVADALFPAVPAPERYALAERCMDREQRYMAGIPCQVGYPEVRPVLELLAKKYRLFIVSNSQRGYPELCMDKLGLRPLFSGWLCHGDTGAGKAETITALLKKHRVSSAVYIGDTQADALAAEAAGLPFIWAAYGFGSARGYLAKLERFGDLPRLLEKLKERKSTQ